MININIPEEVQYIIDNLEKNGFEAYAVGGCVRDILLGKTPQDWDICTSALPEQTMKCFEGRHIIETGLKHGTVTLMLNHKPFEITTYRIDGIYSDNRRPDKVEFVSDVKEDLSRRDFTINAMAYNPKTGIADFFDGVKDLNNGVIKCVGNAGRRFQEDALRIMRALRFAAVLNFKIDAETSKAMFDNRKLLKNIASERIAVELNKLIVGNNVRVLISAHLPVISEVIPELTETAGFEQHNRYHCYDVLEHILISVESAPRDVNIRLTMLFHDIAKPLCYTEANGTGHFYGHAKLSADIAGKILSRLKYDNNTIRTVKELVFYHDSDIKPERKYIKRWLNKIGEERLRQLIDVKKADDTAKAEKYRQKSFAVLDKILSIINEIIEQGQCFALKDLAIDGRDLIDLGIKEGSEIGYILKRLTDMVVDEQIENDRAVLLEYVKEIRNKK